LRFNALGNGTKAPKNGSIGIEGAFCSRFGSQFAVTLRRHLFELLGGNQKELLTVRAYRSTTGSGCASTECQRRKQ
jgi:hypothetical protein